MTEDELNFYSKIGLLSIDFARLESKLQELLCKLIGSDRDLISITLIERNSISQNSEMLLKLNKIRGIFEEEIKSIVIRVNNVRTDRNLFIHGLWKGPYEGSKGLMVSCEDKRVKFTQEADGKKWVQSAFYFYTLEEINSKIKEIQQINDELERIITELEEIGDVNLW
jgi:hypothetical protein